MQFEGLARQVGDELKQAQCYLATAESCTGGGLAYVVTSIPGSSHWFDRGWVTYTNEAKQQLLGVPAEVLQRHGAVSQATVEHMARGAIKRSQAHIAVAISGVAGPGGGSEAKPVGTVYIAWHRSGGDTLAQRYTFHGDRQAVREQAIESALSVLLEKII